MSQFIAVGIEHFRHRVEFGDLGRGEQVHGRQAGHAATHGIVQRIVELDGAGAQHARQVALLAGLDGKVVGIDRFGLSAPAPLAMKELGITADAVVAAANSL